MIEQHQLANGLRIILSTNRSIPAVALSLWFGVGSADESPGQTGLAHLFEHLMFQGSQNVAKGEHFTLIQNVGGRANAATGIDRTFYYERLPSHQLELALWLEAERLAHLPDGLDQATLDNQRDVVRNERRWRIDNQPYGDAEERLNALLYPAAHPYAHDVIGSMADLAAATLDDVRGFFATYYAPRNAVLAIVGDIDASPTLQLIERHFGSIPPGPAIPPRTIPTPAARTTTGATQVEATVALARVYLTWPTPPLGHADWDAGEVVADLLGRGRASRLYASLVRTEAAQAVNAWAYPLVDDPARLTIEATVRPAHDPKGMLAGALDEVRRLREQGPSEAELERVRRLRHTEHATAMERSQERADRIGMYASLLGTPERADDEVDRYEAVDAEAVRRFVQHHLDPDAAVRLTYLPTR